MKALKIITLITATCVLLIAALMVAGPLGVFVVTVIILGISAGAGRTSTDLLEPIVKLLVFAAVLAVLAGVAGYFAGRIGLVHTQESLASNGPADPHESKRIGYLFALLVGFGTLYIGWLAMCARGIYRCSQRPPSDTTSALPPLGTKDLR